MGVLYFSLLNLAGLLLLFNNVLEVRGREIRQGKKVIQIGKEGVSYLFFSDYIISFTENAKECTKKPIRANKQI